MSETFDLPIRPRRLRQNPQLRKMLQRVQLRRSDIIVPVFVTEGSGISKPVTSMPGVSQMSVDRCADELSRRAEQGFGAYLVFGVIDREKKDPVGSAALDPDNVVCRLLRADGSTVENDATVSALVKQAVNHAQAGAAVIAPSGMMDGTVGALRSGLDTAGFSDVAILSYSVKYASAFYGPFRDAADSAPAFGDRRSYQMDPARGVEEALNEVRLDVNQGADMVMVKPAGAYLDVISRVRQIVDVPVVAYQVSGEYSMLQAAFQNGWLDRDRAILESLISIKRAGADLIISYFADDAVKLLPA